MANCFPYYSHIAGNEGPHSTSALNSPPAWAQNLDMQADVVQFHSSSRIVFSEVPQDPFVRSNDPTYPQFQSLVLPNTFLAQGASLIPISSDSDLSGLPRNGPVHPEPSFPSDSRALFTQEHSQVPISSDLDMSGLSLNEHAPLKSSFLGGSRAWFAQAEPIQVPIYSDLDVPGLSPEEPAPLEPSFFVGLRALVAQEELRVSHVPISSDFDVSRVFQNEPAPPEPSSFVGSGALQEEPCQVPVSSDLGMSGLFQNEPTPPPSQSPFRNQLEVPLMRGDTTLVHNPLQQIPPAPSQSQVIQPNAPGPVDIQSRVCPICNKTFARKQERDRHVETFLPHAIYCPLPLCAWRSNRHDNLQKHWGKEHPNLGQAPELQQCQIYDPDRLVNLVVCGLLTIESAADMALSEVKMKAPRLGKENLWADGWGRKPKKFKH